MPSFRYHSRRPGETGGITILVVLLLLVLLTISATAMSRNALREVIISGTSRQGADARSVADSGLEWSIYWMGADPSNAPLVAPPIADDGTAAKALRTIRDRITGDLTLQGKVQNLAAVNEMVKTVADQPTRKFDLQVTYMGPLQRTGNSIGATQGLNAFNPGDLTMWCVRSDASVQYPGMSFMHSREAWFSLPSR